MRLRRQGPPAGSDLLHLRPSLASAALVHLGEVADPETGQTSQQPELARHSISMLEMLHEKTTKGLDEQERKMLESILYELRMKYVIKCGPDSK